MTKRSPTLGRRAKNGIPKLDEFNHDASTNTSSANVSRTYPINVGASAPLLPPSDDTVRDRLFVLFGERLRSARLALGLKQSEVARLTGLTQQYLSLVERGQKNVTLKTMMALAYVVKQDVSTMLQLPERSRSKS
jgi:DNA-binding XRE family transcriptional regulator